MDVQVAALFLHALLSEDTLYPHNVASTSMGRTTYDR